MKIIIILTLSLLLVNADQYCNNFIKQYNMFRNTCSLQSMTINNCCDFRAFTTHSGVYKLNRKTFSCIDVYCDMNTANGGWIVIQRNKKDSLVSFNKNWTDYEEGFGDLNTEFWYGLENIQFLTKNGTWEMRVDYQRNDKTWSYLHYNQFSVGSASEEYPLTVGGFTGVDHNYFRYQNMMKFSTPDNDNDNNKYGYNCAAYYKSGWWYHNNCYHININRQPPYVGPYIGGWVLFSEIKIRPKDCITQ